MFLSREKVLTAGTDGHIVIWPLMAETERSRGKSTGSNDHLTWHHPARIHQSSSKAMTSRAISADTWLIVSGGDDGSLACVLAQSTSLPSSTSPTTTHVPPPILVSRAHGSAVTSCALFGHKSHIFLVTSGNDEWIRLWRIVLRKANSEAGAETAAQHEGALTVQRINRIKTNVADASSMAVLDEGNGGGDARVLVCGVGMEVIRIGLDG